jgi:inorganic pyrophosphatase
VHVAYLWHYSASMNALTERHPVTRLTPYEESEEYWRIVIETPKGSHNKYQFDEDLGLFILKGVLPEGMTFPYDFGFLPATLGDDGDPLDVLLLMDEPAFCGCVVPARLIGVIEAKQTERDGTTEQNDRIVAVPVKARTFSDCKSIKDLNEHRLAEIQQFFVSYNRVRGKKFKLLGIRGATKAESIVKKGIEAYRKKHRGSSHHTNGNGRK